MAAVSWLLGILAVQWLPCLPGRAWLCGLLAVAVLLIAARSLVWRWVRWVGVAVAGFVWSALAAHMAMSARLPPDWEGRDLTIEARVADIPAASDESLRFLADVRVVDGGEWEGRVRLSWYERADVRAPSVEPCETWRLHVRLKRPRGLVNPGGSDAERNHLARGVAATGYVREHADNARIEPAGFCINALRQRVADGIVARVSDARDAGFLSALAVGDTRGLSMEDWQIARGNGISHLIAISGFHVGVAALGGAWLIWLAYWMLPWLGLWWSRGQAQACGALVVAVVYSALAGFGLATIRTVLMIAVAVLCRCSRRCPSGSHAMALASMIMLAADPLAVLLPGFWLSFVGVALLMSMLEPRQPGIVGFAKELLRGQLLMTLALLPLTMWFFGEASLIGAVSNVLAVPLVSLVIVPLALFAALALLVGSAVVDWVLPVAAWLVHALWWPLERLASWPGAHWYLPEVQAWVLVLAMVGAMWMHGPRGLPIRWLGALCFLPLLLPDTERPRRGEFEAWVLDVGQGLSVLVRTHHHALLFDAGARFRSGFDLGEAAVLRSMRGLGVNRLDAFMVSHADNDHAGGASAVVEAFPAAHRWSGEPARMSVPMAACHEGQRWEWDGVRFAVLWPTTGREGDSSNDRSCVLLVEHEAGRLLLTGDISARVEPRLALEQDDGRPLVLQVAHHGSRTSSAEAFVAATKPVMGLVSAGWRNRFGHPHPRVVERFQAHGVPLLNTADSGAIRVSFPVDGAPRRSAEWRRVSARYWRE